MSNAYAFESSSSFCQGLIYSVLQNPTIKTGQKGFTVALVAPHQGAGTTFLTDSLASSLNAEMDGCALVLNCRELASLNVSSKRYVDTTSSLREVASWNPNVPSFAGTWRGSVDFRAKYLRQLRERFAYVLIDCPSLKESTDVLSLAPLVDGFFIVVEANRTQKLQLANLERTLEVGGGKILGHLLNKRTYPIPEWLHSRLESWGI